MRSFFQLRIKKAVLACFATVLFMFHFSNARAQMEMHFNCGTDYIWQEHVAKDPTLLKMRQEYEDNLVAARKITSRGADTAIRIIPVVFHIIHNYGTENISRSLVLDEIKTLNQTYIGANADTSLIDKSFKSIIANMHVQFRLATKDPNGNCTDGITRTVSALTNNADENTKRLIQWDPSKYFNVWVVASINSSSVSGGYILGYSSFPWDNNTASDGVIIRADQISLGNKTLTHEAGHYLGLYHTFESYFGAECGNNCNTTGDLVCDTPPTPSANFNCPKSQKSCSSSTTNDLVEDFMDYSSCTRMFTVGQKVRVDNTLNNIAKRKNLWSASNLSATGTSSAPSGTVYCKPIADFYTNTVVACANSATVTFYDNTSNSLVTNYQWTFTDGSPATSTQQNPTISFTTPGKHNVKLKVWNPVDSSSITKLSTVNILPAVSNIKTPIAQNFENFNATDYTYTKDPNGLQWKLSTAASTSGTHSIFLDNNKAQTDTEYVFELPMVDMSTAYNDTLSFKVAYAQKSASSVDELRVEVSPNCGAYYQAVFYKVGKGMATSKNYETNVFIPDSTQWTKFSVNMAGYKSYKNLMMRFNFKSVGGNNIYIDDIQLGSKNSGIDPVNALADNIKLYPNPSYNGFTLELPSSTSAVTLAVYNVEGRQLQILNNISSGNPVHLSNQMLNIAGAGMYYIKIINGGGQQFVKKVVIIE